MLPWQWGWFGRYVLYSPMGHRMFGTYYKGDVINQEVGVEDNYQNTRGLLFALTESTRRAWRALSLPTALLTLARPRRST